MTPRAPDDPTVQPEFEDQWRARFEEFAEHREDDAGIAGWTPTGLEARLRRFLGLWRPGDPGARWLDAGCGAGTYTRELLARGHDVVGIDYSAPTIRKVVARGITGAAFAIANIREMPFRDASFAGVLCFGVTQALDSSEPAIRELARVLAPGGQMWIDGLNRACLSNVYTIARRRLARRRRHLRYESARRMMELCRRHGFVDVELHWMPVFPARARRLQRGVEWPPVTAALRWLPFAGALLCHSFIVRARKPN